jgi:hypothetical protein
LHVSNTNSIFLVLCTKPVLIYLPFCIAAANTLTQN